MARPPFKPTDEQRNRVSVCAGGGMSHEGIALALGIDKKTLYKYFERELSIGAYEKRAEVIEAMHGAAKDGNVTAQRAFLQMNPQSAVPPLGDEDAAGPKPQTAGKKEQANIDARTAAAGTDWDHLLARNAPLQ